MCGHPADLPLLGGVKGRAMSGSERGWYGTRSRAVRSASGGAVAALVLAVGCAPPGGGKAALVAPDPVRMAVVRPFETDLDGVSMFALGGDNTPPLREIPQIVDGEPLEGWGERTREGRWALWPRATLAIDRLDDRPFHVVIRARGEGTTVGQIIEITTGGSRLGEFEIPAEAAWTAIAAPIRPRAPGRTGLSFEFRRSPRLRWSDVNARGAVMLVEAIAAVPVDVAPTPEAAERAAAESGEPAERGARIELAGDGGISFRGPSVLIVPVSSPDRLAVDVEVSPDADLDRAVVGYRFDPLGPGPSVVDVRAPVVETSIHGSPEQLRGRLRAVQLRDRIGISQLTVDPGGDRVAGTAKFYAHPPRSPGPRTPPIQDEPPGGSEGGVGEPEQGAGALPDVVLVLLGAARQSHLSCYGYLRDTTPNIDRLATASVGFTNAFSPHPYALASIPTILTGVSFVDHRVTAPDDRIGDEVATLAEILADNGYRTAGVTAGPWLRRSGCDEGYEELLEIEEDPGRPEAETAAVAVEEAIGVLDEGGDRPLHLLVDLAAPTFPYDPPAAWDIFRDPTYVGPLGQDPSTIEDLLAGRFRPGRSDRRQLVGYYDGALHAVDAAVGRLLEALRRRPRWDRTLVVVTAAHGAELLDHGTVSDDQLYDTSLRVPLLIRPPSSVVSFADRDRLVTLEDVVPTVLGAAGIDAGVPLAGVDVLQRAESPGAGVDRWFVARSPGEAPSYALRTVRWKAIFGPGGTVRLFDVRTDPGEERNLQRYHPDLALGLAALARTEALRPGALGGTAPSDER